MNETWTEDHWYDFLDDLSANTGRYVLVIGPEKMVQVDFTQRRNTS